MIYQVNQELFYLHIHRDRVKKTKQWLQHCAVIKLVLVGAISSHLCSVSPVAKLFSGGSVHF